MRPVARDRVSVILGVTGATELVIPLGAKTRASEVEAGDARRGHSRMTSPMTPQARIAESFVPWQENGFPGLLGNVDTRKIANKLDLHGTNCVVDAACAQFAEHTRSPRRLELPSGRFRCHDPLVVVTFSDIFMYMCFSKTPASPAGDAKPFDADGDGTIIGEGWV